MATVIDSLVLEFALDPSKFTAGQRQILDDARKLEEQAKKGAQETETQSKKITEMFQSAKRQAIEILATFAGATGIKDFLKNVTATGTSLHYLGQQLNMSGRELSGWEGAVQRMGAPAGSAVNAFKGLNSAIKEIQQTGRVPEGLAFLNRIGGVFDPKSLDNTKALSNIFMEMAKWGAENNKNVGEMMAYFMRIPGMTEEMARLLAQPPSQIAKMREESEKALHVTERLTQEAASFTDQWGKTRQQIEGAGNALMEYLYPRLEKVTKLMGDFAEQHPAAGFLMNFLGTIASGIGTGGSAVLTYLAATRAGGLLRGAGGLAARGVAAVAGAGSAVVGALATALLLASTEPAGGGEDELTARLRREHEKSQLRVKSGAGTASPAMQTLMALLTGIPEIKEVTALDDAYHRRLGANDPHAQGRALDLTVNDPSRSAAVVEEIRTKLLSVGVRATILDEYRHPSAHATGPHIHVAIGTMNLQAPNAKTPGSAALFGVEQSLRSGLAQFNFPNN